MDTTLTVEQQFTLNRLFCDRDDEELLKYLAGLDPHASVLHGCLFIATAFNWFFPGENTIFFPKASTDWADIDLIIDALQRGKHGEAVKLMKLACDAHGYEEVSLAVFALASMIGRLISR